MKYLFSLIVISLNVIYFSFVSSAIGWENIFLNFWGLNWLFFNKLYLFLMPTYTIIFLLNFGKIGLKDFVFFIIPPIIWFGLLFLGGSGANHLIVNPALIGVICGLYLLHFYVNFFEKRIWILWSLIIMFSAIIHIVLPTFKE